MFQLNGPETSQKVAIDSRLDKIEKLYESLVKNKQIGKRSSESSIYIIVNSELLSKAITEKEKLATVKKCGIVYSATLKERMYGYRNNGLTEEYAMLKVATYQSNGTTRGINNDFYVVVLEFAAHCLKEEFDNNFDSHLGTGSSATAIARYVYKILKETPDILDDVKKLIVAALEKQDFVEEKVCSFKSNYIIYKFNSSANFVMLGSSALILITTIAY